MIKAIFWDNDGILVDTEHLYFQSSREALQRYDIDLDQQTFIDISLKQGRSVLDLISTDLTSDRDQLRQWRNNRYLELLTEGPLTIEGIPETLSGLHGKYLMAIVTSCHRNHFDQIHRSTGLLPYFDFVLTREDYQHSKPSPEPYLKALKYSGFSKSQCLVVEDTERGVAAAIAAGLHCVTIPTDLTRGSDFSNAHATLTRSSQLFDYIDNSQI